MNISKPEQRVLHALAQGVAAQGSGDAKHRWKGCGGGCIRHRRDDAGAIVAVDCFTRDGHVLTDCTLALFRKLKRRGLIASRGGGPYRITRLALDSVRAQADQR